MNIKIRTDFAMSLSASTRKRSPDALYDAYRNHNTNAVAVASGGDLIDPGVGRAVSGRRPASLGGLYIQIDARPPGTAFWRS